MGRPLALEVAHHRIRSVGCALRTKMAGRDARPTDLFIISGEPAVRGLLWAF